MFKPSAFFLQCFLTAAVAINIIGHGCVIGFPAILNPNLRTPESYIRATSSEESWIASIVGFALIVGNIIITPLMDLLGRKKCHILTTIPALAGWYMLLAAHSVAWLIAARFLQGISMGMLGPLGSIIIGEMTDPRNRGVFLTSVSLSLTLGVLFIHMLGTLLTWQNCALVCSFITFTSLVLIFFTTESPFWLIARGRVNACIKVFLYLRGNGDNQVKELEKLIEAQLLVRAPSFKNTGLPMRRRVKFFCRYLFQTMKKPEFYKPTFIMFVMYTMFQFAGINVISSYAMDIIRQVVGQDANAEVLMVALDVERLICNIIAVFLMKYMKRRTLLFSTGAICVLAYVGKGTYVYLKEKDKLPFADNHWLPISLIGIYMLALTCGISSIPFALSGEVFPLEYRGLGGGISVLGLSLNFFVAVKSFPMLIEAIGLAFTYYLYAAIVVLCLAVIWFMLPETKDRTLQDIEDMFREKSGRRRRVADDLAGIPNSEAALRRCSSSFIY